jgi:uncharacterized protein YdaU (DUF1376 family)
MAIQKPEWFKLDAARFLSDTKVDAMSTLELGACFRLLCRQWIDGHIPDDRCLLARLCRMDATAMGEAWVTLDPFFPVLEPGKRANRFMWIEREKVVAELERRSDEGTRAARKRWNDRKRVNATPIGKPNGSPMPDPMQDQTRTEQSRQDRASTSEHACSDVVILPSKKPRPEPSKEAIKLASLLKVEILRNKADYKITQAQERSWAVTADRMFTLDGRKPDEAAELIRWAQKDEFWMANVLSMDTLRKKFDQLVMRRSQQAKSGRNGKGAAPVPLPPDFVPASEQMRRERAQRAAVNQ